MITAGVIGWPVAHSKSPLIHRFWLAKLGLDGDYGRFPVHPDRLGEAIRALPALGLRGVNVTVPHKVAVMAYLDEIDLPARRAGAVNTVVVGEDGALIGYNTDIDGVRAALPDIAANDEPCLIGTGGAARAALAAFKPAGIGIVLMIARDETKARSLLETSGFRGSVTSFERPRPTMGKANLIVNATTLGMAGQPPMPPAVLAALDDPLADDVTVFDMVYSPLDTPFLAAARARGLPTVDGLTMLIGQAASAFELFYGARAPRLHDAELRSLLTR